ncbi:hypothetical protein [Pseudomonas viridiflava]
MENADVCGASFIRA